MSNMSNTAYIAYHVAAAQAAERAERWSVATRHLRMVLARQGCGQVRREAMRHIDRLTAKGRHRQRGLGGPRPLPMPMGGSFMDPARLP